MVKRTLRTGNAGSTHVVAPFQPMMLARKIGLAENRMVEYVHQKLSQAAGNINRIILVKKPRLGN